MKITRHRFRTHKINPLTETLIIGTFNPDNSDKTVDFFYGRPRNYLWTFLPKTFRMESLKGKNRADKISFISKKRIDFADLISEVRVTNDKNYYDTYLDNKVTAWKDILTEIKKLKHLKRVCFTRKTFAGIPKIESKINAVKSYCDKSNIKFNFLVTPARYWKQDKQDEWDNFMSGQ